MSVCLVTSLVVKYLIINEYCKQEEADIYIIKMISEYVTRNLYVLWNNNKRSTNEYICCNKRWESIEGITTSVYFDKYGNWYYDLYENQNVWSMLSWYKKC